MNRDSPLKLLGISVVAIAVIVGGGLFFSDVQKQAHAKALYTAANFHRTDEALSLIDAGADVNFRDVNGGTTLHFAALSGNDVLTQALIAHGAKVNAANKYNVTPLGYAAARGHASTAKLLVEGGANPRHHNKAGRSPLQDAQEPLKLHSLSATERAGYLQTIKVLQQAEATMKASPSSNTNPALPDSRL